ncbi:MAG: long-chain-fatty-acid--CoA ligase [Pseudomonadota bacterium]
MNVKDVLRHSEKLHADKTALVSPTGRLTYAEFGSNCDALGRALYQLGLRKGDRVAVLDFNSLEVCLCSFAVPACGLVCLPLNFRLAPAEMEGIWADAGISALIYAPEFGAVADGLRSRLPSQVHLICTRPRAGSHDFHRIMHDAPDRVTADPFDDDLAHLLYTSGTTGKPKGVQLTHGNITTTLKSLLIEFSLQPEDRALMVAPLFHVAACHSYMALAGRGCTVNLLPAFDPVKVLDAVASVAPTFTMLVPAMISALLNCPGQERVDVSSLRLIVYAGAPMPEDLLKAAMQRFGNVLLQVYGLTETSALTCLRAEDHLNRGLIASAGRQMFGNEVLVVDESGRPVPPGTIGEVAARGCNVTAGYWNAPDETRAVLRNGWFHTGDVGRQDPQGYLFLRDRKKELIVSGGENVYPVEVENVLYEMPQIAEAAVIGVPDEKWGERVHAIVHLRPDEQIDPQEIIDYCRSKLAGYKCPKTIELSGPLPRTPSGKVQKYVLRAEYRKGESRSIR